MKLPGFARNSLVLCVSTIISLLAAEAFVRIFKPQDLYSQFSWYKAHPVYRFRHRSNMDKNVRWVQHYYLKTNSRGLREDHDIPYSAAEKWRVVIHGDSFTLGNGVERQYIFPVVAERYLHKKGINEAQVINMGVSAHGPSLQYLYFREEGRKYAPKAVVIAVFLGNDAVDDVRDNAFKLVRGKLEFQTYTIPKIKMLTDTFVYQFLINHSHLLILLRTAISPVQNQEVTEAFENEECYEENISFTMLVWLNFVKTIKDSGAIPVFLLLPTREQIFAQQGRPLGEDPYRIAYPTRQALLKICEEKDLHCVDVLPAMTERLKDPNTGFVQSEGVIDFHYNKIGHGIVGEELGKALAKIYTDTSRRVSP